MPEEADLSAALLDRVKQGDEEALASLFAQHRERLLRMVQFRMGTRLQGRVDAEDIVQEAYLDAVKRMRHFAGDDAGSLFVWLRMIVSQTLINVYRRHLGTQARDAGREVAVGEQRYSQTTSVSLAANLLGRFTSPTKATRRGELAERLRQTLDDMDPIDREVLALRHFEELTNSEVAAELNIQQKAASIRYVRALRRLKDILAEVPGFLDVFRDGV